MIASREWNLRRADCGGTDAIDIAATLWLRLCPDGTDYIMLSHNADHARRKTGEDSSACCAACGFHGQVRHLHQNARRQPSS